MPNSARFQTWLASRGVSVNPKLTFGAPTARGRGVVTSEPLKKWEPMVSGCASSLVYSAHPPRASLSAFWEKWTEHEPRLAAALVAGAESGELSPYFDQMPVAKDVAPFLWPDEEIERLPASVREDVKEQASLSKVLVGELRKAGLAADAGHVATAVHAAYSRPFNLPQVRMAALQKGTPSWKSRGPTAVKEDDSSEVFVPGVDLFNHDSDVRFHMTMTGVGDGGWAFCAGRNFAAGEEVTFSYEKDNDELLARFGFVEEGNPNDALDLPGGGRLSWSRRSGADSVSPSAETLDKARVMLEAMPLSNSIADVWRREKLRILDDAENTEF